MPQLIAPHWEERLFHAMGTDGHLIVGDAPTGLADWALGELGRLEASWSRFRPGSDLCRLNASPAGEVGVPQLLAEAVARAVDAWWATEGRFDATVLDALERLGYDATFAAVRERAMSGRWDGPAASGMADVEVDLEAGVVRRPPGVRFDLGGIGKGLAIDRVAEGLVDRGAQSACLGIGGDVRVAGRAPASGWPIPVEEPWERASVWFTATLHGGAIVASTTRERRWLTHEGRLAHHIVDPTTGTPARSGLVAVIVQAGEAWWAEALAKAALIAGPAAGAELLARHGVTSWMVGDDGDLVPALGGQAA